MSRHLNTIVFLGGIYVENLNDHVGSRPHKQPKFIFCMKRYAQSYVCISVNLKKCVIKCGYSRSYRTILFMVRIRK